MADLAPFFVQSLITQSKAGNEQAARELAGYAARYLGGEIAGPMPEALRAFLADAFAAIASGTSADKALCTAKPARRPRADGFQIAVDVHYSGLPKHKHPGGAYFEIGRQLNKSAGAIEAIYSQYREGLEEHDRINREDDP